MKKRGLKKGQANWRMIRLVQKETKQSFSKTEYVDIDEFNKKLYSGPVLKVKNEHKSKNNRQFPQQRGM